ISDFRALAVEDVDGLTKMSRGVPGLAGPLLGGGQEIERFRLFGASRCEPALEVQGPAMVRESFGQPALPGDDLAQAAQGFGGLQGSGSGALEDPEGVAQELPRLGEVAAAVGLQTPEPLQASGDVEAFRSLLLGDLQPALHVDPSGVEVALQGRHDTQVREAV